MAAASDSATFSTGGTCSVELVVRRRSRGRRNRRSHPQGHESAGSWHLLLMALLGGLLGSCLAQLAWG